MSRERQPRALLLVLWEWCFLRWVRFSFRSECNVSKSTTRVKLSAWHSPFSVWNSNSFNLLGRHYYYLHFAKEEAEGLGNQVSCPRSQTEPDSNLGHLETTTTTPICCSLLTSRHHSVIILPQGTATQSEYSEELKVSRRAVSSVPKCMLCCPPHHNGDWERVSL